MVTSELSDLVGGVDLLCLDAGNTVIFLDHPRLAGLLRARGWDIAPSVLVRTEGEAKLRQEQGTMLDAPWKGRELPGGIAWGKTVGTLIHLGGVPRDAVGSALEVLWEEHVRLNLWSLVPAGFGEAIDGARERGVKVAIVSNSEGMLDVLFDKLGVTRHIDLLLDSGKVGVEKPDPRIFHMATDAFGVEPGRTLHLGDSIATDVLGARAAGIRVALIDPFGHSKGRALDVPRVSGVVEVAEALRPA